MVPFQHLRTRYNQGCRSWTSAGTPATQLPLGSKSCNPKLHWLYSRLFKAIVGALDNVLSRILFSTNFLFELTYICITKEAAKNETHEKLSPGEFLHSEKPWSIFIFGGETRNFHQNGMKFGDKIL